MWVKVEMDGTEVAIDEEDTQVLFFQTAKSIRKLREARAGRVKLCLDL